MKFLVEYKMNVRAEYCLQQYMEYPMKFQKLQVKPEFSLNCIITFVPLTCTK